MIVTWHCDSLPKHLQTLRLAKKAAQTMNSRQSKIQEDTHLRVMPILQDNPDLTQRELGDQLGMSVGGLNYSLMP